MSKTRILAFLDTDRGRDVEILMPMVYFAEKHLNCEVTFAHKWNVFEVYLRKPDLVLLPNAIGSKYYFYISKYAHEQGIKVFALVSEGNFWTNGTYNFYGNNTDEKLYHEYVCYWSERTYNHIKERFPEYSDRLVLTGGVGFDRFKIYDFQRKEDFLKEKQLTDFSKVIGYAGWSFGKLFNPKTITDHKYVRPHDPNRIEWMKQFMYKVEHTLKKLIENNPDTLFILKKHPTESIPSDTGKTVNEMENLKHYSNVLYLVYDDIDDLLNVCDLWMGFDTTTTMESWLIKNNPTFLLHPHQDFFRDELYKGSIITQSYAEIQEYIDEFYKTGKVSAIDDKILEARSRIIKDTIGYDDGINHIRTGFYLKKTIENLGSNKARSFKINTKYLIMYLLVRLGKPVYNRKLFLKLPKFKKTIWIFNKLELKGLTALKKEYFKYLDRFYEVNELNEKIKNPEFWKNLFSKSEP
ncbi:MAG: hypothetical protein AAF843_17375 [Bacteroidota bacterium]